MASGGAAGAAGEDIVISRTSAFSDRLLKELESSQEDAAFTDFKLKTGDKVVECHRIAMAAISPVLKDMLKAQLRETTEQSVQLDNISAKALDVVGQYLSSGKVKIPKETLRDVVAAADFLQMDELKQMCVEQASSVIDTDNVIGWFQLANRINLTDILPQCFKLMMSQLCIIKSGQEFLQLSFDELRNYLLDAGQNNVDADEILEAALDWLNDDVHRRSEVLEDLLLTVPLERCSLQCIKETEEKHASIFSKNLIVYRLLTKSLMSLADQEPLRKKRSKKIILIDGRSDYYNQWWRLHPPLSVSKFCTVPDEQVKECRSYCETSQGFAISGGTGRKGKDCVMYVGDTNEWIPLANLLVERHYHASLFVNNLLFIFGGYVDSVWSSSVHYLDESGKWQETENIPEKAGLPEVASIGKDVYLLEPVNSNKLFKMNTDTKKWSRKQTLQVDNRDGAHGARMIRINDDKLCVVGGFAKILAWYTPSTDTWVHGTNPQLSHIGGAVVLHQKSILILGGSYEKKVERYDMESGEWSMCDWELPITTQQLHALRLN